MRVLVVEDDPVARRQMEASLQRGGFEVLTAADGETAWRMLEAPDAPRLVVLDWILPLLDGQEILVRLRADTLRPYVHVIMVTIGGVREDGVALIEAGADGYLRKPFDAADLRARVRSAARALQREQLLEQRLEAARRELSDPAALLCPGCRAGRQGEREAA